MAEVIKLIDSNTSELVSYEQTDVWFDGTPITDARVENVIYRKAGNLYYKRITDGAVLDPRWFGAKGDGVTDDTEAIKKMIPLCVSRSYRNYYTTIVFPVGYNFLVSDTIQFPRFTNIKMQSPMTFKLGTKSCLVIGEETQANTGVSLKINVQGEDGNDWSDDENIGLTLINLQRSTDIFIDNCSIFTVGLKTIGMNSQGYVYNTMNLGRFYDCKNMIHLTANSSGWNNENIYMNGTWGRRTTFNPGISKTGVKMWIDGTVTSRLNNNIFYKTSFEPRGDLEVGVHNYVADLSNAIRNKFISIRCESVSNPIASLIVQRLDSDNNLFDLGRNDVSAILSNLISFEGLYRNSIVTQAGVSSLLDIPKHTIFKSEDFNVITCQYSANTKFIKPPLFWSVDGGLGVNPSATNITLDGKNLQYANNRAIGIRINTSIYKRLVVNSIGTNVALYTRALDSSLTNISTEDTKHITGSEIADPAYITAHGGGYSFGAMTNNMPFAVNADEDTAYIDLLFAGPYGGGNNSISSISVEALDGISEIENPTGLDYKLLGTILPTTTGDVKGKIVYNASKTATNTTGWEFNGTSWVSLTSQATSQADSTATDITGIVSDFNALLAKLRTSGQLAT